MILKARGQTAFTGATTISGRIGAIAFATTGAGIISIPAKTWRGNPDMRMTFLLACVATSLVAGASSRPAFAWGCTAVAGDGAYGYSYNWPSEQDAELRALNECEARSTSGDCSTESCDPNG
jgi:hypothetical protein